MHGRVTGMGMGIVAPKTAIASFTLKLCLSHKRMNVENGKIIKIIENNELIEKGFKVGSSGHNNMEDSGPNLWTEGARKMLKERSAKIQNQNNKETTSNKTIMDYALEHANDKAKPKEITNKINYVRL